METIIFEKDQKTKEISLDLLKQTASLADPYTGKLPSSRPIEHWQFIENIQEQAYRKNLSFNMEPIYIGKGESKKIKQLDPENLGRPESYLFQRIITKLNITTPDFVRDDYQTSIAIGYTEKGVQVAFGTNVHVCSNMCIFGGRLMTSYGGSKMPFDKLMELVQKHMNEIPTIAESDFKTLEYFSQFPINNRDVIETVGEMQMKAVQGAYFGGDSPLNIGQVSHFSQGLLKTNPNILESKEEDKIMSLYDFYNMGTQILHPKRSEVSTVWPGVADWGDFLTTRYGIANKPIELN